jgi:hypothetical protein
VQDLQYPENSEIPKSISSLEGEKPMAEDGQGYARTVVGTDAGEAGDRGEDHPPAPRGFEGIHAPGIGAVASARFQHDGWAAHALALEVEPAAADVDEAGEVTLRGDHD